MLAIEQGEIMTWEERLMDKMYRNMVLLFVGAIALVLALFLGVIPMVEGMNRPAYLEVLVAPVDATVKIGDKRYRNAMYEMEPGEYTATMERNGFLKKEVKLNLERGKTTGLYAYLDLPSEGGWEFYEEKEYRGSLEALLRLGGYNEKGEKLVGGALVEENDSLTKLAKKIGVRQLMPMELAVCGEPANRMNCDAAWVEYDYAKECADELCVIITGRAAELGERMLNEVRGRMRQGGYELSDYRYVYLQDQER